MAFFLWLWGCGRLLLEKEGFFGEIRLMIDRIYMSIDNDPQRNKIGIIMFVAISRVDLMVMKIFVIHESKSFHDHENILKYYK